MGVYEDYEDVTNELTKLKRENRKLRVENKELKEWRKHWEAGAADRRWKALGGSW